jgi:hypothetical protein
MIVIRLWDLFWRKGWSVIHKVSIAILKIFMGTTLSFCFGKNSHGVAELTTPGDIILEFFSKKLRLITVNPNDIFDIVLSIKRGQKTIDKFRKEYELNHNMFLN